MNKISISIVMAALLMYGCSDKPEEQEKAPEAPKEQTKDSEAAVDAPALYGVSSNKAPQADSAAQSMPTEESHIGKVIETVNAANYTYAKVNENGNIYWIAGPETTVKVGSEISFIEQMTMQNFTSKALNRTFDVLVFASTIISPDAAQSHAAKGADCDCDTHKKDPAATMTAAAAKAHTSANADIGTVENVKVAKNANGHSVEELYSKSANLKGKSVKVNAQVVKVSKNIMGKDWVHLQDGSGAIGTNDIIATGKNTTVQVGDVVTTTATLNTDVDFGYGYFFSVILEESTFTAKQ